MLTNNYEALEASRSSSKRLQVINYLRRVVKKRFFFVLFVKSLMQNVILVIGIYVKDELNPC